MSENWRKTEADMNKVKSSPQWQKQAALQNARLGDFNSKPRPNRLLDTLGRGRKDRKKWAEFAEQNRARAASLDKQINKSAFGVYHK